MQWPGWVGIAVAPSAARTEWARPRNHIEHSGGLADRQSGFPVGQGLDARRCYNKDRPHQGLGNLQIGATNPAEVERTPADLVCQERLGGLLKHYERKAA